MSSTSSFRERGRDMHVKLVDYDDFPEAGRENVTGFFREIGALNAAFSKRFSQMMSLHPCTPLGETLEEYVKYQQSLEDKYHMKLGERGPRKPREEYSHSARDSPHASTPPSTSSNFARLDYPKFGNIDAPSPKSTASEENIQPTGKRKAENFDEPIKNTPSFQARREASNRTLEPEKPRDVPRDAGKSVNGQFSSGFFSSDLNKPAEGVKSSKGPETTKSVFSGFNLNPSGNSTGATGTAPNFNSVFGQSGSSLIGNPSTLNAESTKGSGTFSFYQSDPKTDFNKGTSETAPSKPPISFPSFNPPGLSSGAPLSLGGFSFGSLNAPKLAVPKSSQDGEDDDADGGEDGGEADIVPIVPAEEQEVVEADAIVSRQCHVFYLDNGAYVKRGTGTAHVKPVEGANDAVQVLVRAKTALGAILLNTRVSKSMKATRMSQPNGDKTTESVQLVCHATPAFKGSNPAKLYQFTLKFRDKKEADEFFKAIESNI